MGSVVEQPSPGPQATQLAVPTLTPEQTFEMRVRAAERAHDTEKEFGAAANAAAVKNAEEAIKTSILINGGSSVAMLAFIGTLVSRDVLSSAQIANITKPLLCFGCGVAASVVAAAASYFTNLFIATSSTRRRRSYVEPFIQLTAISKKHTRIGECFRWIGILSMTASIGCFIWGLASAESAFSNLTQSPKPIVAPPTVAPPTKESVPAHSRHRRG